MHCTKQVLSDMLWVGADDRRLTCFEGVYGVPEGVSYNSEFFSQNLQQVAYFPNDGGTIVYKIY